MLARASCRILPRARKSRSQAFCCAPDGRLIRYNFRMAPGAEHCEWTRYYRPDGMTGVAALHAHFIDHKYPRHAHAYSVVGLVESGVQSYSYRGSRHFTPAGRIFVVNHGEPHTGEAAVAGGYVYRTLCLDPSVLARALNDLSGSHASPCLEGAVFDEPDLAQALSRFHRALTQRATVIEQESLLLEALMLLLTRHSDVRCAAVRDCGQPRAVARARDYIDAHFAHDISLAKVAESVSLSPFYFARLFARVAGMPPHAYLESVRIRNACSLLDKGESIASVAASVGYADQSHLTKRFRRFLGITPLQYVRDARARLLAKGKILQ
jgi:AraC-like DNA-binding protein